MGFAIPTLGQLVERGRSAFRAHLAGSDAWLWPNNVYASAKVIGGAVYELFGFADYIYRQRFAHLADGENLDLHGIDHGLARRPALPATGALTVTVSGPITIPVGAIFARTDGREYAVREDVQMWGVGAVTVRVSDRGTGIAGNLVAGAPMTSGAGVPAEVTAAVVAADGISGGADVEGDETFRARILFRKRNPPHGGAPADYVMWATEVPGVSRVYVERRWNGAGTVRVFPMFDGLRPDGLGTAGDIAAVRQHLEALAPAGAELMVMAPARFPIDVTVSGFTPDNPTTRQAAVDEVIDMLRMRGGVAGSDTAHPALPFLATPLTLSRSWFWQAVANAAGEERHVLVAPSADVVVPVGAIPVLNNLSFV